MYSNPPDREYIAQYYKLPAEWASIDRITQLAQTQLSIQATQALALDAKAIGVLAAALALLGVADSKSRTAAIVLFIICSIVALLAVAARGAEETGADLVELLRHHTERATMSIDDVATVLARRAIQAREDNRGRLRRKYVATSLATLILLVGIIVLIA
ncbi:MAG: hypothetical protein ACXVVQ_10500 [Solirubrobacteraceae bacterium]